MFKEAKCKRLEELIKMRREEKVGLTPYNYPKAASTSLSCFKSFSLFSTTLSTPLQPL
jgi:hypothetical protein